MDGEMTLLEEWRAYLNELLSPENLIFWGTAALKIIGILIISYVALKIIHRVIDGAFKIQRIDVSKQLTLTRLLKSVSRYIIFFLAALTILRNINIDLGPVLAGAGVVGLAIGFGAQSLVRDVITGFFIIFEDQFSVGEYIMVNNSIEGTVEDMGLRTTLIREWNGRLHHLANGEITQVTNYNRERMRPLVHIRVPYEENMTEVFVKLEQVCAQVGEEHKDVIIESPSVFGITDIEDGGVRFTVMALSTPSYYWFIERQLRKAIIETFQDGKIEIAYPRRVYMDGKHPMFN